MADSQYEIYRVLSNHFVDTLKGLETLKYLGKSEQHEGKIEKVSKRYRKATMRTLRVAFLLLCIRFLYEFINCVCGSWIRICLIDGTIILLPALTILILAPEYFLPIKQVGANYHATLDGQIAMEQIEEILQQQKGIQKKDLNEDIVWNASSSLKLQDIKVNNTESEKAILEGINFTWEGNGAIGVIGESGAGKSTLIDVLAGFYLLRVERC